MYRQKITKSDLRGRVVIRAGYCAAYYLTRGLERLGYNSGVYGWNYDAFDLGGVILVTGYRPDYGDTFKGLKDFEERAERLSNWRNGLTWEQRDEKIKELRAEFVAEVLAERREKSNV